MWSMLINENIKIFLQLYVGVSMDLIFQLRSYRTLRDMCNIRIWSHEPCEPPNFNFKYKHIRRSNPIWNTDFWSILKLLEFLLFCRLVKVHKCFFILRGHKSIISKRKETIFTIQFWLHRHSIQTFFFSHRALWRCNGSTIYRTFIALVH